MDLLQVRMSFNSWKKFSHIYNESLNYIADNEQENPITV